jgi:hypothetical protein
MTVKTGSIGKEGSVRLAGREFFRPPPPARPADGPEDAGRPAEEPRHRWARSYATVLIGLGVSLWALTVGLAALVPYTALGRLVLESGGLPPDDYLLRWLVIPSIVAGLIIGGLLSLPLMLAGTFIRLRLSQRAASRELLGRVADALYGVIEDHERLREEVRQLRAENERLRQERAEIADALAKAVHEVLMRLRFPRRLP